MIIGARENGAGRGGGRGKKRQGGAGDLGEGVEPEVLHPPANWKVGDCGTTHMLKVLP